MADNASHDEVALVDHAVVVLAVAHQLAVPLHGLESAAQGLEAIFIVELEHLRNAGKVHGHAPLLQGLHDELTAGNGIVVFFRLAGVVGVFG